MSAPELDFLWAFGEELCRALSPPVPDDLIVPHDGYEVWRRAFGTEPSPVALAALDIAGLEQLRAACVGYFECPLVSTAALRLAVYRTLGRWPARQAQPNAPPDRQDTQASGWVGGTRMDALGELTLAGHRFPIHSAMFRYITDDGQGHPGWEFNICTQPPIAERFEGPEQFLFASGVRFYAKGDPIPLDNADDLTGVEVYIEEPVNPNSGEVYFTLFVGEHRDVSHVRLRFLERRGSQYRIRVSALAHNLFAEPTALSFECWITRQPSGRFGAGAEPSNAADAGP